METITEEAELETIISRYQALAALVPLGLITCEADYDRTVAMMDRLLDAGAADEGHPLSNLIYTLGMLVAAYDAEHYPPEPVAPVDLLKFLMEQQGLNQVDLPEIGSQGVVSEILRGKRKLNLRQVNALATRFGLPVSVFTG